MTIQAPRNVFKQRLLRHETQFGLWMSLASPMASEALSLLGYDWLLFDTEHSPVEVASVQSLLQAAAAGSSQLACRPAWNDRTLIKRILDIGTQTLLVPFVQNAEEAAAAVSASRYPPDGTRGVAGSTRASRFGLAPDYFSTANENTCVLVQLETEQSLDRLEEIAAVNGVDGCFIGPSDLAASMGHLGNPGHADVQKALKTSVERLRRLGKPAGILATNPADARRYAEWGYGFVAVASDLSMMVARARETLATIKGAP